MVERKDAMNLIPGTDGGLLVHWLLNKQTGEGSRFLFIEIPELLQRLHDERLLPDELPEHIVITTPDNWLKTAEELSLKDYFYIGNVFPWRSLAVVDSFHDGYVKLWNHFDEQLGQYLIAVGQETGSRIFMLKCLENLPENRTPILALDMKFQGRTAILLSGGPSLNESFDWVKKHRDNLAVLAVTRIAKQLAEVDLVPDLFFAIDPHDIIFHQSKHTLEFHEKSLLINMYHLNPRLMGLWRGRSLYMGTLFPWESPQNPESHSYPGITVSHQALGAAIDMGFARIILAGFDLCFSREGFTHARGSVEMDSGPYVHRSELWVETNGGWQAETRSDFFNALPALHSLADYAQTKGCEIINPAASAAKIAGVAWRPWDTLHVTPITPNTWDHLQHIVPPENAQNRRDHYHMLLTELQRVEEELTAVRDLTAEAVECNDLLFGRKGGPADFQYKIRMDAIETILDEEHREFSRLVKKWSVADFLRLSRPNKSKEWSDEEIETIGRRYYEVYRDSAINLLETLANNRTRIQTRLAEEEADADLATILDQYEKDGQEGRVPILLSKRQQSPDDFPEAIRQRLHAFQEAHRALMEQTETDYKDHCKNQLASPNAICSKVMAMFQSGETERLRHFMDGVQQSGMEHKEHFLRLIRGLLAEHDEDFQQALTWYRQISFAPLILTGLQRQLAVYLRQGSLTSACAVAKRLGDNSLLHLPFYADLLRLTGDKGGAIATLTEYTKLIVDDFVAMIKLGQLLLDDGDWQGAQRCCQEILAKDGGHKAALMLLEKANTQAIGFDGDPSPATAPSNTPERDLVP